MSKFTDDERNEKAIEVANYIIGNNSSTRKAAEQFGISNATVSDWMNNLLKNLNYIKFLRVQEILTKNRPKTIEDAVVRERVLNAAELIKQNFTVEEIAKYYKVTVYVINEDLQTRLPRISIEKYNEVKKILNTHSMGNLKNVNIEQEKGNENNGFTK